MEKFEIIEGYDEIVEILRKERDNYFNRPHYSPRKLILVYEYTNFQGRRVRSTQVRDSIRACHLIGWLGEMVKHEKMKDLEYYLKIYP